MYSMVLFIVETSFSGFFGSGRCRRGHSRGTRQSRRHRPSGERDLIRQSDFDRKSLQVVEAVTEAEQRELAVRAPVGVHDFRKCAQGKIDTVLGAHDPQVYGEIITTARNCFASSTTMGRITAASGRLRTTVTVDGSHRPLVSATRT